MEKTNVIRQLDAKKVAYKAHDFSDAGVISALDVAAYLNLDPKMVFKTLVTVSKNKKYYVFVLPATKELDLKKAAKAVNEKSIDMLPSKELLGLTGYIHGGCSPVGMKKFFPTTFDESVNSLEVVAFSACKVGYNVEVAVKDIGKLFKYQTADITKEIE
jgi:Cys-tRNA(Pro)/Cys-tRNA(Cys) deacylase